jgi:hypothetical protein
MRARWSSENKDFKRWFWDFLKLLGKGRGGWLLRNQGGKEISFKYPKLLVPSLH